MLIRSLTFDAVKPEYQFESHPLQGKGGVPALTDTMAGQIQGAFIGLGGTLQYVQNGCVLALVVTSAKRNATLPELPTLVELGYYVFVTNWYGVVILAETPQPVINRLYEDIEDIEDIGRALAQPDVRERFTANGC